MSIYQTFYKIITRYVFNLKSNNSSLLKWQMERFKKAKKISYVEYHNTPQSIKPYKVLYHVFVNRLDCFFDDFGEAAQQFRKLYKEGYSDIRLYIECYASEEEYENDDYYFEDCLFAFGCFPL